MISLAYAALWIFVFSVPWERIIVLTNVSVVTRAAGALALTLALLAVVISGRMRRWRVFHVMALLFVIWAGVGVLVLHLEQIPKKYYTFVQLLLVVWMIWELAPSRQRQIGLLFAYLFGAYVAALDTILLFARQAGELRRFASAGSDPNNLAMTLALGLPMAWYLGMTHRRPLLRWICRGYLPIALLAIGLTGSRGGMITSMVALLIVPLAMTHLSPSRLVAAISMLLISGALAVSYVPDRVVDRLASTGESVQSLSIGGRFKLWKAGLDAYPKSPVLGHGTATYKHVITPKLGMMAQVAHNSFISVLVEEGLVGLLFFLSMLAAVFFPVMRLPRLERRFALVLFATLFVAMLPLTWEDQKPVWLVLAMLIGLAYAEVPGFSRAMPHTVPRPATAASPYGRPRAPLTPAQRNYYRDPRA